MAFSCARFIQNLQNKEMSQENIGPFLTTVIPDEEPCEDVIPEVLDVMNAIFDSLSSISFDKEISYVVETKSDCFTNETFSGCNTNHNKEPLHETPSERNMESEVTDHTDVYDFEQIPLQVTGAWKEFYKKTGNNFTKGCKWAPDGSCILTCSDDNSLKLFNLPQEVWDTSLWQDISEMEAVVRVQEGELAYDYCWYPLMNSSNPCTSCFISCSRNKPVHLWDAFTGELRCSYRSFDHVDELVSPRSLSFDVDGQHIFCGFEKIIRVFDINLPGRNCEERKLYAKKSGQHGIISCFAFSPTSRNISVAGSYNRTIGIYSEPGGSLECILEGQKGGVTQVLFSPDGNLLYSGGRKDPEILCWDMRNLGNVLYCLRRSCVTNQRMYFDISRCGKYVISGNQNGVITIWDTADEPLEISPEDFYVLKPKQFFLAHDDCVNGISIHPNLPFLCSTSGQRKFADLADDDNPCMFSPKVKKRDNSLRLWWIGNQSFFC